MPTFPHAVRLDRAGRELQDRAAVFEAAPGLIVAVADGAGGTAHGGRAADLVLRGVESLRGAGSALTDGADWAEFLAERDTLIAGDAEPGETTAVVLGARPGLIVGASVGDSEAWLIAADGWHDLTAGQRRKPLLGSGAAVPVPFRRTHAGGILVAGSDGLFKYAPPATIRAVAARGTPEAACAALVDLVRLRSGALQDDVAVVVCHLPGPGLRA